MRSLNKIIYDQIKLNIYLSNVLTILFLSRKKKRFYIVTNESFYLFFLKLEFIYKFFEKNRYF
jgi:hypothetical protein